MANVKISALPVASAVSASAVVPIVQSNTTQQANVTLLARTFVDAGYPSRLALGDITMTGKI